MVKTYAGDVTGRSITQFSSAFDQAAGIGSYVALESFEGSIGGRTGTLNFVHAASTSGEDRSDEYGLIVAGSGTGELAGATGTSACRWIPTAPIGWPSTSPTDPTDRARQVCPGRVR